MKKSLLLINFLCVSLCFLPAAISTEGGNSTVETPAAPASESVKIKDEIKPAETIVTKEDSDKGTPQLRKSKSDKVIHFFEAAGGALGKSIMKSSAQFALQIFLSNLIYIIF